MRHQILLTIIVGLALISLSACSNTAEGIGRDVERAGKKIQDTF